MKKCLVVLVLLTSLSLVAVTETFNFKLENVKLELENVTLKDVEFHDSELIEVSYHKDAEIKFDHTTQVLSIVAQEEDTKIKLYLPKSKKYLYENSDGICTFDNETLNFDADDAYIIISEESLKVNDYSDGSSVLINDEGIFVEDSNECIRITDSGIHIESDEPVHLDGIFGNIIGSLVRSFTNVALSSIGRTPDQTFKYIVNNENEHNSTNFYKVKI
ncbi:MAG: hypothetical protein P9M11_06415 [Candidatus Tenebribacter burtonii]|nr:hypothetical protein [Candidatus Tenebribacter burtonii]